MTSYDKFSDRKKKRERWCTENGMAAEEVRLMAEGRMVGWDDLANLADGATVRVLGDMRGGMGKKSRNRTGREFHLGRKTSLGRTAVQLKNSLRLSRKMN